MQRTDGLWYWAEYSMFSISDEVGKYQLTVAGYSGDAGDAMAPSDPNFSSNGMMFTTMDDDNDAWFGDNCAQSPSGGWWYCSSSSSSSSEWRMVVQGVQLKWNQQR